MDKTTHRAIHDLIRARQDLAITRLQANEEFQKIIKLQKISEEKVEALYKRFSHKERLVVSRHYEGELGKEILTDDAIYIQGLRDCFALFDFLRGKEAQL